MNNLKDRQKIFHQRLLMLKDDFSKQALTHLSSIYADPTGLKLDKQLDTTNNIFKTIIHKISRVYSFGFDRTFDDNRVMQLYKDIRVNKMMQQSNIFLNAFNDLLIQVQWVKGKPRLTFRLPHEIKVRLDEFNDPIEVEYLVDKVEHTETERWAYWSNTEHYYKIYDNNGEFKKEYIINNDDGVNPYGVLPFVFMQNGFRFDNFFDTTSGNDLVRITLDNAVYNTFKNYMIKWQSFKQMYSIGAERGDLEGKIFDPQYVLNLSDTDAKLGILDLQANLKDLRDTLGESANTVAINYNISPTQFNLSSVPTSGFSKMMENASLDESTRQHQKDFLIYEKELYKLILIVSEYEGVSYNGDMTITINEPFYKDDKKTQLDVLTREIDLGVNNQIKYIMKRDNISEDEATQIFNDNLSTRNKSNQRVDIPTAKTNLGD